MATLLTSVIKILLMLQVLIHVTQGGLLGMVSLPACYGACNAGAVACYAAGGLVFGTVTLGAAAPAVAVVCSAAQGAYWIACTGAAVAPIP